MPTAVKLSAEFVEVVRREARTMRRSMAGQVEYWADLGRRCERLLGSDKVRLVLEGKRSVHELSPAEDSHYVELLSQDIQALDGSDPRVLDELVRGGHPIAGEDSAGRVVVKRPRQRGR